VNVWLQLGVCLGLIGVAGAQLSRYGDVIADKTGLGGTWVGVILLATVTSLPELATGVSAVTVMGLPEIAIGDALGSCVFNLVIIVVLDFLHRKESVYRVASQGHVLSAGLGIMLIGLVGVSVLLGDDQGMAVSSLGHVGF
jgi:cation:H+ antiporter